MTVPRSTPRPAEHIDFPITVPLVGMFVNMAAALFGEAIVPVEVLHVFIPVVTIVVCAVGASIALRRVPFAAWSPVPWFLLASAAYFGIGPLSYPLGDRQSRAYADDYFPVSDFDLVRTNLLNSIGIALVLLSFKLFLGRPSSAVAREPTPLSRRSAMRMLWLTLAIGLPVKYFLALPYTMGLTAFTLPGTVLALGAFSTIGLSLSTHLAFSTKDRRFWILSGALIVVESMAALLTFSKTALLEVVLGVLFGFQLGGVKLQQLIRGGIVVAAVYAIAVPFVDSGRRGLERGGGSLDNRVAVVGSYSGEPTPVESRPVWRAWSRLCYANAQAFAMEAYDHGQPGTSMEMVLWSVVPRFVYPDKPITTVGAEFNRLVTGNADSQSTPGTFAEGYWNAGWLGVVVITTTMGAVFAWFSRRSFQDLPRGDYRWLAGGFFGLMIGLRPTDWFAATYVGGVVIVVGYLTIIRILLPDSESTSTVDQAPPGPPIALETPS